MSDITGRKIALGNGTSVAMAKDKERNSYRICFSKKITDLEKTVGVAPTSSLKIDEQNGIVHTMFALSPEILAGLLALFMKESDSTKASIVGDKLTLE